MLLAASTMPRDGSAGVLETFHTESSPVLSSIAQMSVKVPPESTPNLYAWGVAEGFDILLAIHNQCMCQDWRQSWLLNLVMSTDF
ncbi:MULTISPECIES: hypothetical protein [unclassified Mesorhizobium]|uniref:hypothetical protein n=1 Tax=unclassified Mesorhizobium TaxID=325217 RepID=UPI001FEFFCC9|nr:MULTISPECIES: hypothetical protein [unclassified Mesorhizobium]